MTNPTPALRCQGVKPDGSPCGQTTSVSPSSGYCIWHDSERAEEAKAARERGVEKRTRKSDIRTASPGQLPGGPPDSLEAVCRWASWVAWAAASGVIDARTARETSYALQTLRHGLEKRDLGRELADLKQQLKALTSAKGRAS